MNGFLLMATGALLLAGCERKATSTSPVAVPQANTIAQTQTLDPLALILVKHEGENRVDIEIRKFQEQVRRGSNPTAAMERLGWAYVAKARASFDPGYYLLAEKCADAIVARQLESLEALLLRGHAMESMHRFKETEVIARSLVAKRGLPFDFGLLGDSLMEQGKLDEAANAYQHMVNLRPDLHSYSRIAHLRWLKGDVEGAAEAMQMAAHAASPLDAESAAWVYTRLSAYQSQLGAPAAAEQGLAAALEYQNDYAPALLLRGRQLLNQQKNPEAVEVLTRAAKLNPLPEYQWALADALREAGRADEAAVVETELRKHGAAADERSFALFLATRGDSPEAALHLTERELETRQDIFSYDALAWSLAAAGKIPEAQRAMDHALAEGTEDARLFFHAAVIATRAGQTDAASQWLKKTAPLGHLLLPSERNYLQNLVGSPQNHTAVALTHAN